MVQLAGFDARLYPTDDPLEPVPTGRYTVVIIDSQRKPTQSGIGHYLQLCLEVIEGDCAGRTMWLRLNLENPNPSIVALAATTFASVCRAVGFNVVDDSRELHGIPFSVRVRRFKRPGTREPFNKLDRFTAL